jgi:hypothetical protein
MNQQDFSRTDKGGELGHKGRYETLAWSLLFLHLNSCLWTLFLRSVSISPPGAPSILRYLLLWPMNGQALLLTLGQCVAVAPLVFWTHKSLKGTYALSVCWNETF